MDDHQSFVDGVLTLPASDYNIEPQTLGFEYDNPNNRSLYEICHNVCLQLVFNRGIPNEEKVAFHIPLQFCILYNVSNETNRLHIPFHMFSSDIPMHALNYSTVSFVITPNPFIKATMYYLNKRSIGIPNNVVESITQHLGTSRIVADQPCHYVKARLNWNGFHRGLFIQCDQLSLDKHLQRIELYINGNLRLWYDRDTSLNTHCLQQCLVYLPYARGEWHQDHELRELHLGEYINMCLVDSIEIRITTTAPFTELLLHGLSVNISRYISGTQGFAYNSDDNFYQTLSSMVCLPDAPTLTDIDDPFYGR
ncbi:MAG: hypothetical protein ACOVRN_16890 [Flavobacterium sp.]